MSAEYYAVEPAVIRVTLKDGTRLVGYIHEHSGGGACHTHDPAKVAAAALRSLKMAVDYASKGGNPGFLRDWPGFLALYPNGFGHGNPPIPVAAIGTRFEVLHVPAMTAGMVPVLWRPALWFGGAA